MKYFLLGDPLLESSLTKGTTLCSEAHKTAVEVIFSPVSTHFQAVQAAKTWKLSGVSADLPDFSFSPQEYITQVLTHFLSISKIYFFPISISITTSGYHTTKIMTMHIIMEIYLKLLLTFM
jgi:hypothetical protein